MFYEAHPKLNKRVEPVFGLGLRCSAQVPRVPPYRCHQRSQQAEERLPVCRHLHPGEEALHLGQ